MTNYLFLFLTLVFSSINYGQTTDELQKHLDNVEKIEPVYSMQSDYLVPAESLLNSDAYRIRYYQKLKEILFDGLPNYYDTRFLSLPSFHEEEVLLLKKDTLYYNTLNIKIWHIHYNEILNNKAELDTIKEKIRLEKHIGKLSNDDAELLKKLYRTVLSKTRYRIFTPNEMNRLLVGNDGTSYNFSISNYEQKDGKTWSPKKDSKMYRLVEIHKELIKILKNSDESLQLILNNKLKNDIKKLIDEVNLSDLDFENETINTIKDTIVSHLNKKLPIKELIDDNYYVPDDLIFTIRNGEIKKVKEQEPYYDRDYSKFRNWFNNLLEKKVGKHYKRALKNLDLTYLNLELDLKVYIDFELDKESFILTSRK